MGTTKKRYRKKRIIASVTSDLVSDNRVHKSCATLASSGFDLLLVGRRLRHSRSMEERPYATRRFRLLFRKGPLFYAGFNVRLFLFLLFSRFDILLANDLDVLPANFLASKLKGKALVYDSHEYFTEVPELVGRLWVRKVWEQLELLMVPRLKHAYTVCDSIARIYSDKYGIPFRVVRNMPYASPRQRDPSASEARGIDLFSGDGAAETHRAKMDLCRNTGEEGVKIILYQGAVNKGRGLAQVIRAMQFITQARLVIAGDGDIRAALEALVRELNLQERVCFLGRLPIEELTLLTPCADLGLSVEEELGLNYLYALPNKLFDYIQARVPVLVSALPEMAAVVRRYGVGEVTASLKPEDLAAAMQEMLTNGVKRDAWKQNLERAAAELTWENEQRRLINIFAPLK